jgi:GTPase SAR1 family protein
MAYTILTQTKLDYHKINQLFTYHFFNRSINQLNKVTPQPQEIHNIWNKYYNQGRIFVLDLSSKDDYKKQIQVLFQHFNQPQLVFFGDIKSLSLSVQEAALKLLEEPPKNLTIILYACNQSDLLPTIKSRVQIISLSSQQILSNLDQAFLEIVKKKLPPPAEFSKQLLTAKNFLLPDLKDVEREELDFWLWQIEFYLQQYYIAMPNLTIADKIAKVNQSINLNNQNLQKKFALANVI